MGDQSQHSPIPPSGSYQWVPCGGSVPLQKQFPETETEESLAGEASHWVASACISMPAIRPDMLVGQEAPNGEKISVEMAEAAAIYVSHVLAYCSERALYEKINVEKSVKMERIHPEAWGTPDSDVFDADHSVMRIYDYKYGWGIVEAFENWQGICYAIGVIDRLIGYGNPRYSTDENIDVEIVIAQPRPFHAEGPIRTWRIPASDLRGYANQLHTAAAEALGPDPETRSGSHCKYCSARHNCRAAQKSAMFAIDVIEQKAPAIMDGNALGAMITRLRRASQSAEWLLTALESEGLARIRKGELVPGYIADHGLGQQQWKRPKDEIVLLGDMHSIDLKKPVAVVTPKQAERLGISTELVDAYSLTPKTALKLISDLNQAKKVFT